VYLFLDHQFQATRLLILIVSGPER